MNLFFFNNRLFYLKLKKLISLRDATKKRESGVLAFVAQFIKIRLFFIFCNYAQKMALHLFRIFNDMSI
jgi:hypothetical protein